MLCSSHILYYLLSFPCLIFLHNTYNHLQTTQFTYVLFVTLKFKACCMKAEIFVYLFIYVSLALRIVPDTW